MVLTLVYSNRDLQGEYKPTAIDAAKVCQNRLIDICGKYYTVVTENGEKIEFIGRRSFMQWAKTNTYVTDF